MKWISITLVVILAAATLFAACAKKDKLAGDPPALETEALAEAMPATTAPAVAPAPTAAPDGKTLLETRCTKCHTLDRVHKKKTDRSGWEKIVAQMVKNGAAVTEAERQTLVEYLATLGAK